MSIHAPFNAPMLLDHTLRPHPQPAPADFGPRYGNRIANARAFGPRAQPASPPACCSADPQGGCG